MIFNILLNIIIVLAGFVVYFASLFADFNFLLMCIGMIFGMAISALGIKGIIDNAKDSLESTISKSSNLKGRINREQC